MLYIVIYALLLVLALCFYVLYAANAQIKAQASDLKEARVYKDVAEELIDLVLVNSEEINEIDGDAVDFAQKVQSTTNVEKISDAVCAYRCFKMTY